MTGFEPEPGWTMSVDGADRASQGFASKEWPPICAGAFAHILPAKKEDLSYIYSYGAR
jgi:hypothetical protein